MFQIFEYIKFLFKSTNQHGVHSPFVYDLVTQCFYDTKNHPEYAQLKSYRTSLLKNNETLTVSDFGSGSRVFKSNSRTVNQIAKHSGTSFKRAKLLFRITNYFKPERLLELGTSLGIATQAMALGNSESVITSIEGCQNSSVVARQQLANFNITNVTLVTGKFEALLPKLTQHTYDFIFIDGNHNKEATLSYFNQLIETIHNDSIFVFDDIHWSKGMVEAWNTIKNHPKVSVTIDTFFWGFVCFRKEQVKQNFSIRL